MSSIGVEVEYYAGLDPFGEELWIVGRVVATEERGGEQWFQVEPAFAGGYWEEGLRWVRLHEIRAYTRPGSGRESGRRKRPR